MKKMKLTALFIIFGLFLLSSCSISKLASIAASTAIDEGDTNKDGYMTLEEYWNYHKGDPEGEKYAKENGMTHKESTTKDYKEADTSKDDKLTEEELKNWTQKILQKGLQE